MEVDRMKLSEKIVELRKQNDITQEQLADVCGVSRQSISKWEADIALPETEKLLIISETFHVSLDVLLKDELSLNEVKEIQCCGENSIKDKKNAFFEGALIKESIDNENILDLISVNKIELWNTGGNPKYWTVLFFTTDRVDFPEQVSKVMIADSQRGGNWFVDFKSGNDKYIVFRNKILKYQIGNQQQKDIVCEECRKLGILDTQMNWAE